MKNFTTEFKSDGMSRPIRNFKKIAMRYVNNGFFMDLIMVIPFANLLENVLGRNAKLCYFIKCYRLVRGLKIFNVSEIIGTIQKQSIERM